MCEAKVCVIPRWDWSTHTHTDAPSQTIAELHIEYFIGSHAAFGKEVHTPLMSILMIFAAQASLSCMCKRC